VRQRQDARRLPSPRRPLVKERNGSRGDGVSFRVARVRAEGVRGNGAYGEDEVGHVAVAGDDLEAADGVGVADDVRDAARAVLLDPGDVVRVGGGGVVVGGGNGAGVGWAEGGKTFAVVEGKVGKLPSQRREGFHFGPRSLSRRPHGWTAAINQTMTRTCRIFIKINRYLTQNFPIGLSAVSFIFTSLFRTLFWVKFGLACAAREMLVKMQLHKNLKTDIRVLICSPVMNNTLV
jgi:hypothetical protein